jgi:hypothetical protein
MNRKLIVVGTLALVALPSGALAVEDTLTGEQLGEAAATVTPFRVGEDKVVFAGPEETPNHARTVIVLPDERDGTRTRSTTAAGSASPCPTRRA